VVKLIRNGDVTIQWPLTVKRDKHTHSLPQRVRSGEKLRKHAIINLPLSLQNFIVKHDMEAHTEVNVKSPSIALLYEDQHLVVVNKPCGMSLEEEDITTNTQLKRYRVQRMLNSIPKNVQGPIMFTRAGAPQDLYNLSSLNPRITYIAWCINTEASVGRILPKLSSCLQFHYNVRVIDEDERGCWLKITAIRKSNTNIDSDEALSHAVNTHWLREKCAKELNLPVVGDSKFGPSWTYGLRKTYGLNNESVRSLKAHLHAGI
jgi:hypothetical protein